MSSISIKQANITELHVDALVNAVNTRLQHGSGVCGAIFTAAGAAQMQAYCNNLAPCPVGSAVVTPGFNLLSKYVVHAVGPIWHGGLQNESQLLYKTYLSALQAASLLPVKSIGFPLISTGAHGFPIEIAWRQALLACRDFLQSGGNLEISFAVLNADAQNAGLQSLYEIAPQYAVGYSHPESPVFETLLVAGHKAPAVFFHKPFEQNGWLSNWYLASFTLDGVHFSSTEQYIMYQKCRLFGDYISANAILATNDPGQQQAIGQNAKGYVESVWSGMRQLVALRGLTAKFTQNAQLKSQLLATGAAWLVECSHHDKKWACGASLAEYARLDAAKWTGQNILGFALMEARDMLKAR